MAAPATDTEPMSVVLGHAEMGLNQAVTATKALVRTTRMAAPAIYTEPMSVVLDHALMGLNQVGTATKAIV